MLDFNCDRQDKADLTASTINYLRSKGYNKDITFYEEDENKNLVPFNSPDADIKSRLDVWMLYGTQMCVIEMKGRGMTRLVCSDTFPTALFNEEKIEPIREEINNGNIVLWAEPYVDDKIRIWNLNRIDKEPGLENLNRVRKPIKKVTIDPNSKTEMQERLELPHEWGTLIPRVKGYLC